MSGSPDAELTVSQAVDRLRLIDDEMMRTALQDQTELVQFILRIIMEMPDLMVTRMETQKDLLQIGRGRSLALDVWAVDSDGTQYDIEIQRSSGGAQPYRSRYHLSVMDAAFLRRGSGFDALPKTKVIFITENDCIGTGELMESFVFRNHRGRELGTGQEIIYLNTAFHGSVQPRDEEKAALAHDFRCTDPAGMNLEPLAERMRFLKDTEKGRTQMSSVVEQYARQEAAKAAAEASAKAAAEASANLADVVRRIFDTGKHTPGEIADLTGLSVEEVYQVCGLSQT